MDESPPENFRNESVVLDDHLVYEVVHSKRNDAVLKRLTDSAFAPLTTDQAEFFTGSYFSCREMTSPYLIRAPFSYGGKFTVMVRNGDVLVDHFEMGHSSPINHSALVVCLERSPGEIYSSVNVTE